MQGEEREGPARPGRERRFPAEAKDRLRLTKGGLARRLRIGWGLWGWQGKRWFLWRHFSHARWRKRKREWRKERDVRLSNRRRECSPITALFHFFAPQSAC